LPQEFITFFEGRKELVRKRLTKLLC
jgi:hypothetical protein